MSDLGNKEVFSKNLKKYIELSSKERKEIAEALGVSYSTFTDWVNGNTYPRIDKIEMLACYFNISKADLIEENNPYRELGEFILMPDEDDLEMFRDIKHMTPEQKEKLKKFITLIKSNLL